MGFVLSGSFVGNVLKESKGTNVCAVRKRTRELLVCSASYGKPAEIASVGRVPLSMEHRASVNSSKSSLVDVNRLKKYLDISSAIGSKLQYAECTTMVGYDSVSGDTLLSFLDPNQDGNLSTKSFDLSNPSVYKLSSKVAEILRNSFPLEVVPLLILNVLGPICDVRKSLQSLEGNTVIVLGGTSPVSVFAVWILSALGAKVYSVTNENAKMITSLGAEGVLDPRLESFSEKYPDADLIVDTLGDESQTSATLGIREKYVSVCPGDFTSALDQGLASRVMSIFNKKQSSSAVRVGLSRDGIELIRNGLEKFEALVESEMESKGSLALQLKSSNFASNQSVMEASRWPRDVESGARFGFAAPSLWSDAESENEQPRVVSQASIFMPVKSNIAVAEVDEKVEEESSSDYIQMVDGLSGLSELVDTSRSEMTLSVLFLSAGWCRRCKYVGKQYERIAEDFHSSESDNLRFYKVDSVTHEQVAKQLGVDDVPEFVVYKNGERQAGVTIDASNRAALKNSIQSLL